MQIRAITPIRVGQEELSRRQARYDRLAPHGMQIILEDLPDTGSSPTQLATQTDLRTSERLGIELGSSTDPDTFDALLPDCVLDPGVPTLDKLANVPVLGITRLSAHLLASLGLRFGVLTRNSTIGEEYRSVINRYGLDSEFTGSYVLGLDVDDISDTVKWNAAVAEIAASAEDDKVVVLLNGCSAVETTAGVSGIRIVDPTALALKAVNFAAHEDYLQPTSSYMFR